MKVYCILLVFIHKYLLLYNIVEKNEESQILYKKAKNFLPPLHFNMKPQTAIILLLVFVTLSMTTTNAAHLYANAGLLLKLFGVFPYDADINDAVGIYGKCFWQISELSSKSSKVVLQIVQFCFVHIVQCCLNWSSLINLKTIFNKPFL